MRHLFSSSGTALTILSLAARTTFAVDPEVELDYTSYVGTALSNGVTEWIGVRYAAPPLGDLRFRAPVDPMHEDGPIAADTPAPVCLGTGQGPPSDEIDEDCLFLSVWAPSNATSDSRLPVYFFIQGGGFNTNSGAPNGTGLVIAGDMDMVVVNFNYRVGPYGEYRPRLTNEGNGRLYVNLFHFTGFLAGAEVEADGSFNNGLKDQRKAMEWVQNYISRFGGDPGHVTIGGASAGAQSVDLHVLAYGGRDDGLFHATAAESQSFPPLRNVNESQFAYDNLVIRSGCSNSDDTLSCLRNLTAEEMQSYTINTPFPGAQNPPLYMFGPTLDFDFITDYSIRQYAQGKFVKVPAIAGDDNDEGTVFANSSADSIGASNTFMKDQFPLLTPSIFKSLNARFPLEDAPEPVEDQGAYFRQLAWVYGEVRYICLTIYVSGIYANESIPNWNYRWNVQDPESVADGLGVTHTVEVNAIFGPAYVDDGAPDSYAEGGVNAGIVAPTQAYWTSFVRTYDPNTYKLASSPRWEEWTSENYYARLKFETNSTMMETVPEAQQERCAYLSSIAVGQWQ